MIKWFVIFLLFTEFFGLKKFLFYSSTTYIEFQKFHVIKTDIP